ncbi:hypothetical protein ACA910_003706 [Epithemia clementina (nom. ined.)]
MSNAITNFGWAVFNRLHNYYHPMFRSGSVVPLWHMMTFVSVTMYTAKYFAYNRRVVLEKREMKKEAMKEYIERHGIDPHHH